MYIYIYIYIYTYACQKMQLPLKYSEFPKNSYTILKLET